MMRVSFSIATALAAAACWGQTVEQVYNRDTNDPFKLKSVKVESTVVGPIVRTSTLLTYDNPFKHLTEASIHFELPDAAVLSGFAYYYGDEYVKGRLMDKAKAWFIYTAITSRNEDPGIMVQWTPTEYHCQIFPIKMGSDFRVRLYTVAFLQPKADALTIPRPSVPLANASYSGDRGALGALDWSVRTVRSAPAVQQGDDYKLPMPETPVRAVAQKFKDGRVYVAGLMHVSQNKDPEDPTFAGIKNPKVVNLDPNTIAFMGLMPHKRKLAARFHGTRVEFTPEYIYHGSETARLWAQQMLADGELGTGSKTLRFSLKYGVPSTQTALLAVPSEEMKVFQAKQREWQKQQAEERKSELAESREQRGWEKNRNQNWNNSGGGDPEIRIRIPGATKVQAILPDRRVVDLQPNGDVWGGNFEIPAEAPEGIYAVRVLAQMVDGSTTETQWSYTVDRTPPEGQAKFVFESNRLFLEVRSDKGLAEVAAYGPDGAKWVLKEVTPGVYRIEIPRGQLTELTVVMKDRAGNKGEIVCSLPQ